MCEVHTASLKCGLPGERGPRVKHMKGENLIVVIQRQNGDIAAQKAVNAELSGDDNTTKSMTLIQIRI